MSLEELRAKARQKQKNALREGEREKEFRYKQKKSKTPLEVIGERPESQSSMRSANSFKISPRLDGADVEMMHYALGGDLNNIQAFDVGSQ